MDTSEKLWDLFNQLEIFDEPLTDKMRICMTLEDTEKDSHIQKHIKLEKDLLYFYAIILHSLEDVHTSQNKLDYYYNNIKSFIEIHNSDDFNYYRKRFSETLNQSDKIRYGLIVWLYFKDIQFFDVSIKLLLVRVKFYLESKLKEYVNIISLFCVVYNIVLLYKNKDYFFRKEITDIALSIINQVKNTENIRWIIEPLEIIIKLRPTFDNQEWINILKLVEDNADILVNWDSKRISYDNKITKLYIQRHIFDILFQLIKFPKYIDKDKEELRKKIREKIGKSLEIEAELRLKDGRNERIIASMNYQEAANEYQKASNELKYNECIQKMKDNHKLEDYEVIESKIEFVPFAIEGMVEQETINNISNLKIELLNDNFIKNILNQFRNHPLLSSFPLVRVTEIGKSSKLLDEKEDIEQSHILDNKVLYINWFESNLSNSAFNLEKDKKISSDRILQFLKEYGLLDEDNLLLIKKGLDYHFSNEYIPSIYILIPQIEVLIKKLLEIKKLNYLKEHKNAIMNKELGGLITDSKDMLGEDMMEYLKIKYTERNGINFRNKLSHGYLEIDEFNHRNSFAIIFALLKLIKYAI